jgi:Flp pilus assembly protein TadG
MSMGTCQASKQRRGTATLEFAIAGPLLLLMLVGAADFGRVFYHVVTLANAAGTGAFYGSQSLTRTGHTTTTSGGTSVPGQIDVVAKEDAKDLGTALTAKSERVCKCPDGSTVNCISGTCTGYGSPRVYVKVQVTETFNPIVRYPGVPKNFTIGRTAYMRAQ